MKLKKNLASNFVLINKIIKKYKLFLLKRIQTKLELELKKS